LTGRRLRSAIATFALALGLAACSSGGAKKAPSDCQWPTRSANALALVTIGDSRGHRLEAYNPRTGARVGSCAIREFPAAHPEVTVGRDEFAARGYAFRVPLVAGPDLRVVPDNPPQGPGGVRDLRTGVRHALSFADWQVVSAIGKKLLLEAVDPYGGVSTAADWCVLPSVSEREARCSPVPGAKGNGMATVSPTGAITWVPAAGQTLRIGSVPGFVSTDGHASVLAFGAGTILTGPHAPLLAPAAVDQQTIVFAPNSATPHPAGDDTMQWARVRPSSAGLRATVHDARVTTLPGTGTPFDLTEIQGLAASPDGTRLLMLLQDHTVYEFSDGGGARKLVTLQVGGQAALLNLVSWPFTGPAAAAT
jgi:hypothetical protein